MTAKDSLCPECGQRLCKVEVSVHNSDGLRLLSCGHPRYAWRSKCVRGHVVITLIERCPHCVGIGVVDGADGELPA